jgi:hypothetical protein
MYDYGHTNFIAQTFHDKAESASLKEAGGKLPHHVEQLRKLR